MILDDILAAKREEVARRKLAVPDDVLRSREPWSEPRRGFAAALRNAPGRCVIAEIKKASPSRGVIRRQFDPALHARQYQSGGATCISVLTDERFFQGSLADLEAARRACTLPLLRKDFVIDEYQVVEARAHGADAILLIVAALSVGRLRDLAEAARELGLDVLTEVHDRAELDVATSIEADPIGINNRDLRTFVTSTDVTRRLLPAVPEGTTVISESGLGDVDELCELEDAGVRGFLIGETFMASPDPEATLAGLVKG